MPGTEPDPETETETELYNHNHSLSHTVVIIVSIYIHPLFIFVFFFCSIRSGWRTIYFTDFEFYLQSAYYYYIYNEAHGWPYFPGSMAVVWEV